MTDTLRGLYTVTLTDEKLGADRVRLPVPRTDEQVADLQQRYRKVEAKPYEPSEGQSEFATALAALAKLYTHCEKVGNAELGRRADAAFRALLGKQQHLEITRSEPGARVFSIPEPEDDPFPEDTMSGLGGERAWR